MTPAVASTTFDSGIVLELIDGDLTRQKVDAIVNAANERLQHGGGVAAAIVRQGGDAIQVESDRWVRDHGPISHGQPALTTAGELPCDQVIHVVGPRWGEGEEAEKLATAVASALKVADAEGCESLALPPISTGIFGYPKEEAAEVILSSIEGFAQDHSRSPLRRIRLTIIDEATLTPFRQAFVARWPVGGDRG